MLLSGVVILPATCQVSFLYMNKMMHGYRGWQKLSERKMLHLLYIRQGISRSSWLHDARDIWLLCWDGEG